MGFLGATLISYQLTVISDQLIGHGQWATPCITHKRKIL